MVASAQTLLCAQLTETTTEATYFSLLGQRGTLVAIVISHAGEVGQQGCRLYSGEPGL